MPEELQRVHDKINYETNVVDPKTFAILLQAVKENQPLSYEKGRDTVFPNARASAGMQWDPTKVDTHASGTLEQYCLVNATEDRTITVSDLGYKFLSCFDENYNVKVNPNYYKTILLQMIFSWVELEHDRNIHPGRMLFKLMLDPDLEGYHTNNEFALWTSNESAMTDSDYDKIKQLILDYRANPSDVKQKKAEVFLRPFANSWDLFNRIIDGNIYTFTVKEDVLPLIKQFFIYIKENETDNYPYDNKDSEIDESQRVEGGTNILLYGVPGSGKSWTMEHEYCKDESRMERLVFHPDYTYSDFVGQILPNVSDGMVSYKFTPGPFTSLVRKAYTNPDTEYFLVIEEINRGNAPAIFGEVFQLLDRKAVISENDDDGYPIGTSEYGITNTDMAKAVYGNPNHKVRIPSNMSIIATMNTSDQNVFTLDTAFQRRWDMRMIENSFDKADDEFANHPILDSTVTWKTFCTAINKIILDKNVRMTSSEDKRLGVYFVQLRDLIYDENADNTNLEELNHAKAKRNNSRFPEKVLKYLWDDAFKFSREDIFEVSQFNSLEAVVKKFAKEKNNDRFKVFKENVYDAFVSPNEDEQNN